MSSQTRNSLDLLSLTNLGLGSSMGIDTRDLGQNRGNQSTFLGKDSLLCSSMGSSSRNIR